MLPKIPELRLIAKRRASAAVVCISESWLDFTITDAEILLEEYTVLRNDRNRQGGGLCSFIRSDLAYNTRTDLHDNNINAIWYNILSPKSKPILVGTFYNPHRDTDFRVKFNQILSNIHPSQETYGTVIFVLELNFVTVKHHQLPRHTLTCFLVLVSSK